MPKYKVAMWRSEYSLLTFNVEANDKEQAEDLALQQAFNTEYPPGQAEYSTEYIKEQDEDHTTEN